MNNIIILIILSIISYYHKTINFKTMRDEISWKDKIIQEYK